MEFKPGQASTSHLDGAANVPSDVSISVAYGGARPKVPRQLPPRPQARPQKDTQQQINFSPRQKQQPRYVPPQQRNNQQQQSKYSSQVNLLADCVQEQLQISGSNGSGSGACIQFKFLSSGYQNLPSQQNHNKSTRQPFQNNNQGQRKQHYLKKQQPHQHQMHHTFSTSLSLHQQQPKLQTQPTQNSDVDAETVALNYLHSVIQCLNQTPGEFNTIATRFLNMFDGLENSQYVLSIAMEDIFEESLKNPNFRYMGAKLYNLLHMLNLKSDSTFHRLLNCKLIFNQLEIDQFMENNQQGKVRDTTLFLVELYMQLRGDDSRIQPLAKNIVYALQQLLSPPPGEHSAADVRCVCLTLKLTGYDLTADCAAEMQEIIAQLEAITAAAPGKFPIAANVIELQRNNWGRQVCASNSLGASETANPLVKSCLSDELIIYGSDGRELSAEECAFLESGAVGGAPADDEDCGFIFIDIDPEMDEDTEQTYNDFFKLNANGKA